MLSREVVETDHNLEQVADAANGQLAQHRWHWTLDESNPGRVNISEYARQVGRAHSTIAVMVRGYASYSGVNDTSSTLDDHIGKARMSGETGAAAEAVAKARGISVRGASDPGTKHHHEVRRVRDIARQRAEERGTSVEEEAPKVAEMIVRSERAEQAEEALKREHRDIRFVEMEGYLVKAKRELLRALKLVPSVPWGDEETELLSDTVGNIKALLGLIDTALSGTSGVDWDAEFVKVAGNEKL